MPTKTDTRTIDTIDVPAPPVKEPQRKHHICYDASPVFADCLDSRAKEWGVSQTSAARRLSNLGACGLSAVHHDHVHALARLRGGPVNRAFEFEVGKIRTFFAGLQRDRGGLGFRPREVQQILAAIVEARTTGKPVQIQIVEEA